MVDPGKRTLTRTEQHSDGIGFPVDWQVSGTGAQPPAVAGRIARPGERAPDGRGPHPGGSSPPASADPRADTAGAPIQPGAPRRDRPVAAATRLDMANVVASAVIAGGVKPGRMGVRPPTGDEYFSLRVVAWVNNLAYDKEVWLELSVITAVGEEIHGATVPLEYEAPAGGGGDLFAAWATLPQPALQKGPGEAEVSYRLYYRVNDSVFTDGTVHTHPLGTADPFPPGPRR